MNTSFPAATAEPSGAPSRRGRSPVAMAVSAGVAAWLVVTMGFVGLRFLMQERPQFAGQPLRTSKMHLLQRSPSVVMRRTSEDASVIRAAQPVRSAVDIELRGRRDYRGLRTVVDMGGELRARYWLSNAVDEPVHLLFQCPHPTTTGGDREGGYASGLEIECSKEGQLETEGEKWVWGGRLEPAEEATITIAYQLSALRELTYQIADPVTGLVNQHRIRVRGEDLPTLAAESADGRLAEVAGDLVWERANFPAPDYVAVRIMEGRHLYGSLAQLVEIGPLVSLLFLLAALGAIHVRQPLNPVQVFTLAAAYALYFPLVVYLCSRFSFAVALTVAVAVPGVLLLNFLRWILGFRVGTLGGMLFLGLYQVFPTLAAFAGWNRGMVLLCLGTVTLAVLIHLQNRSFKLRKATMLMLALVNSGSASGQSVQLLLPVEQVASMVATPAPVKPLLGLDTVRYHMQHEANHILVTAELEFRIVRAGEEPVRLFSTAPHLISYEIDPELGGVAEWVTEDGIPGLYPIEPGRGHLRVTYRVPVELVDGRWQAEVPLVLAAAGIVELESARGGLRVRSGALWNSAEERERFRYVIGVAGRKTMNLEWFERSPEAALTQEASFYGIGIARSRHLTVVHSDGSCAHFAEYELPEGQAESFLVGIERAAKVVSVSVNGIETSLPPSVDGLTQIALPGRGPGSGHRVSLRLGCPPVELGFVGALDLRLPEVTLTAGTLQWVVAFPSGFDLQITASGLEPVPLSEDLELFGEYGRLLHSQPHLNLTKELVPPKPVVVHLRYRQELPGE